MPKTLNLYQSRVLQITFVFMFLACIDQYGHVPHSSWVIVTGCMIYAGFDPGTVLKRAYLRIVGTIVGIASVVIVWHTIHIDYRLDIFFLVLVMWAIVFSQSLSYQYFVLFATIFADLSVETVNSSVFQLRYYVTDRLISTAIAFSVCIIVERLWFGKTNFSALNCQHLIKKIQQLLDEFYTATKTKNITRSKLFREILLINQSIFHLKTILADHKYETTNMSSYQNTESVVNQIIYDFRQIICLIYLKTNDQHNPAIPSITAYIEEKLSANE